MTTLARKLNLWNYFALAFGSMIGTGWVVLMDDWLGRGGPFGVMLGFALGGALLLPVGYVYGQWVKRLPDAAGEAAYTAQVFPPFVSYLTGWIMLLSYFIVCPWEAVAVGKLAAYIFPGLDQFELYRVAGQPVFLPRLVLGVTLTLFLAWLNHRGIRASAVFQNSTSTTILVVFVLLVAISGFRGAPANLQPHFSRTPWISILLALQIVPYFLTGFESVPKVAEESHPGFPPRDFFKAIAMALLGGAAFYALTVCATAYVSPWHSLLGNRFATAVAFERGTHVATVSRLILAASLVGLIQCFNGNFVVTTRLLFAFGRRRTIPAVFSSLHAQHQTPAFAILAVATTSLAGLLLGDAILVPGTEVGSMTPALGWLAACDGRARRIATPHCRAGNRRFIAARPDETSSRGPRPLLSRRMDCLRHLARPGLAASPPRARSLECGLMYTSSGKLQTVNCHPERSLRARNSAPSREACAMNPSLSLKLQL